MTLRRIRKTPVKIFPPVSEYYYPPYPPCPPPQQMQAMAKRRNTVGALLAWLAVLPRSAKGWQLLFRQFKLWRKMVGEYLLGVGKTPWYTLLTGVVVGLYVLLPFDLIPDFLLFFGWLDDMFVIVKMVSLIKIDLRKYANRKKIDPEPYGLTDK